MNVKVFTATASEIPRLEANINLWIASIEATGQVSSTNLARWAQTGGMQPFVIVTVWYRRL